MSKILYSLLILLLIISCEIDQSNVVDMNDSKATVRTSLPLTEIELNDLSSFKTQGNNWFIAGDIYADFNDEDVFVAEDGEGILVNKMTEDNNDKLETSFEHGDLELEFEFMMPKSSNSGIYFQGRYELQLFDSYGTDDPAVTDLGAIYERWDDSKPEGQKGYEGHPPILNASKAPGLWQRMKVYFRAPKFDESNTKIEDARFESVYLNGILIQDNVTISGPTRSAFLNGEEEFGPLIIQGDHGNIAFKNIKYKSYTQDSISLSDLTYAYFDHPHDVNYPLFDTVSILKEGSAEYLNVDVANENSDHYGLIFKGKINIPRSGEYLFHTGIDDGGEMLINDQLIVFNEGNPGYDNAYNTVDLSEGEYPFEFRFYDNVWSARIDVNYEGPQISKHRLGGKPELEKVRQKSPPILLTSLDETELVRSFIQFQGSKKTHAISVGSPKNIHYSYDLNQGNLLLFWRGEFADVTEMWKNRGQPQLLKPLNASIEGQEGLPFVELKEGDIKFNGYEISKEGIPVFDYESSNFSWTDKISPNADGTRLIRNLKLIGNENEINLRAAKGERIRQLPNGLYSINGLYYIETEDASIVNGELLISSDQKGEIQYELFW